MKKPFIMLVFLSLILTACCSCKNNTPEFKSSLLNQEGIEVSFPQDKPVVFFFFDTYRNPNSQNQLILLHKNLSKLEDIDANIYLVSKDSPEELKKFEKGIKKLTGKRLELISDPFTQLGELTGLKDKDTLHEGYAILSTSGKIVLSVNNDKYGVELSKVASNIKKHYKSKNLIELASANKKVKSTSTVKKDNHKEEPNQNSENKEAINGELNQNNNTQNNGEIKDGKNPPDQVVDTKNNVPSKPIEEIEKVYHQVVTGDSLTKIALEYKVPIEALKENNNVEEDTIMIGQKLFIYESVKTEANTIIKLNHKVVDGEVLSDIAKRYNTTPEKIIEDNKITNSTIYPEQVLVIQIPKQ